jgi:hypothetical protein
MDNGSYSFTITVLDVYHRKHEYTIAGYNFPDMLVIFETSTFVDKYMVAPRVKDGRPLYNTHKDRYNKWVTKLGDS